MKTIGQKQWDALKAAIGWTGTEGVFERQLQGLKGPTWYPMTCSWCEAEGMRTITGYSKCEFSNRICSRHLAELNESVKRRNGESEFTNTSHEHESRNEAEQATSSAV